ncbi:hypothetical protein NDA03_23455 [Trichocoleus sp. Lan]|uniref:hypothetical protein n=1 Tax=Trichocoleus sp. Lan TaxID=2933927 RepID=UPI00329A4F02
MLQRFLIILVILVPLVIAYLINEKRKAKIKQIKNNTVVLVKGAEQKYPSLPLKNYGIPLMVRRQNRVQVVFPRLTPEGDVEYIYSWHPLNDVEVIEQNSKTNDPKLTTIKELAPIIHEHWQLEPEMSVLEEQYRKINDLADLVSTSDVYSVQVATYEKALLEVEKLLRKAEQLQKIYVRLIREALIGVKVAEYNPDRLIVSHLAFELQYQRMKEEYQHLKDVAHAYSQLLNESRNLASEE